MSADEKSHQDRDERYRQHGGETHGQRLRPCQRPEHPPFLGLQQEHRQKRDDDDDEGNEDGRPDLLGGVKQDAKPLWAGKGRRFACLTFGKMPVAVLDHHDGRVHEHTDGKS